MLHIRTVFAVVLAACLIMPAGCGEQTTVTYEANAGSYTADALSSLAGELERPAYAGEPVVNARELRHDALVDLRKQGDDPAKLANLLTDEFPADTRAVPFWCATAVVGGRDAWLVAEAWGPESGALDNLRIWAFDRTTGEVIASAVIK